MLSLLCTLCITFLSIVSAVHIHPDQLTVSKTNPPFSLYVYPRKEDFVSTHVHLSGMWNRATSALMVEFLSACGLDSFFLDFGANIGR